MMQQEIIAWAKVIFSVALIVGVAIFIGVINANYEGDNNAE